MSKVVSNGNGRIKFPINEPCENKINEQQYNQNIKAIRSILKGNFKESCFRFIIN